MSAFAAVPSNLEMKHKEWPCRVCTYLNPARQTKCEICHNERPDLKAVFTSTSHHHGGGMAGTSLFQCDSVDQELTGRGGGPESPTSRLSNYSNDITMDRAPRSPKK